MVLDVADYTLDSATSLNLSGTNQLFTNIDSIGNTFLVKDATNKYFAQIGTATPIAIENSGQQIYENIHGSDWQTIATETVNGDNQVLWKNVSGNYLHIWHLDNNWNWASSEGAWALNSAEAWGKESVFGIDANGDGVIGNPYIPIDSIGNTFLVKDPTNKYFTQVGINSPTAIKNGGQQISQNIYGLDWQTLATETVNGDNQILWKNTAGNYLHIWHLDNNWNWVSSEGQWALNSPEALTQETKFGIDVNGDGKIGYGIIEAIGNTKLVKDAANEYFTQIGTNTPTAIKNGGQQIYQDIYGSGWQTIATETVNGDNQVLWKNVDGNYLHIWHLDNNWNWVSSEGQWALNSLEASTQETNFGIDANGDGFIGYDTLNTARDIVIGSRPIYDSVSNLDLNDFYRFTVSQSGIFTANLTGLTGDADVRLIQDKNNNGVIDTAQLYNSTTGIIDTGEILAWQWERGTGNEALRSFLNPGTYYLQVMSYNNQTANYNLATNFTPAVSDDRKFSIQLNVDSSMNATAQATIRKAADLWEKAISYSSFNGSHILTVNVSKDSSLPGWMGIATGQITRRDANGRYIPISGEVRLSPDVVNDLNKVSNSERNPGLLVHEIGHILGLVGWAANSIDKSTWTYNANTYAGWVYGELKGTFTQTTIPMMTGMGPLYDYTHHWNKDVFGAETMTSTIMSLSQLSLAALRDVGWNINYGVAQPYSLPALGGTGNTLTTAVTDLGTLTAGSNWIWKLNNVVNSEFPDQFYKIKLDGIGTLNATLDGLTADANMRLIYDANNNGIIDAGEVIATSTNTGTASESFNLSNLAAGTYYVNVYATNYVDSFGNKVNIKTSYNLNFNKFAASAPPIGNNLNTVTYDMGNFGPGWATAWNGTVGDSNFDDLFRFNFTENANFTVNLIGLTDNADISVIYDSNKNGLIDTGEVILTSNNLGNLSESITRAGLLPGTYYFHINRVGSANTPYQFRIAAFTDFGTVVAGTARNRIYNNNVNVNDGFPNKFYKIKFDGIGTLNATLDGLTDDANMRLIYDANNNGIFEPSEVIATSTNTGTTSESFNLSNLAAGTYYVDVYATNYVDSFGNIVNINTAYNLNTTLTVSAPPIGNNLKIVNHDFGTLTPKVYNYYYVVNGFVGDSSIDDLFRFNFAGTTNLTFSLTGLTDNADMSLIYDSNNNGLIDPGEVIATSTNLGNLSETITLSGLLAGNYYLYVYRFASTVNTRYRLQLENLVIT
ncbi:pre-peptidase C-terminal domain-containing protein [Dolichospermum sp. UHCC 0259]|uniref:pre-peptidase C-terminal domain-containing protein n=1 Tax=Dolichospermum sp. UHCC 0259 TaxID=2590010 RepID=UPI001447CC14|nr:pre-peptidase C-terminal domain-containing protein [Dolichospermum sp. UHCC 0259]MTJ48440.1 hypothetical protein [Dolichospermum sp. UHCC 0259]